jgi:hypothetical protein
MTVPTAYMSIPSLNILQNFNLVFTLAVAFLWLGTRFEQPHYAGCVLVVLAGFASIVVELQVCGPPGMGAVCAMQAAWAFACAVAICSR